jgi:hypothetical protein
MESAMDFLDVGPEVISPAERVVWTQGIADALGWGVLLALVLLLPGIVLFTRVIRRRRLWCAQRRREVEVVLDERGLPGFRHAVAVRRCSAFDPPTAITCRRRCLHPEYQLKWAFQVPGLPDDREPAELADR